MLTPLWELCPDVLERLHFMLLHLPTRSEREYRKHGCSIQHEADFVIVYTTDDTQFDQFTFQPSPMCLTPDDDIVMLITPFISFAYLNDSHFEEFMHIWTSAFGCGK